jgi:hypothetical protein
MQHTNNKELNWIELNYYYKSIILIKRASLANQDGSHNIHDYRMLYSLRQHLWPVLCQKLWHYSNMCINNDYMVNKLSAFVFQNISIIIHCNSILNEILFMILHLHIITWEWQEQGPLFQVCQGPKEFLKHHCLLCYRVAQNVREGSISDIAVRLQAHDTFLYWSCYSAASIFTSFPATLY